MRAPLPPIVCIRVPHLRCPGDAVAAYAILRGFSWQLRLSPFLLVRPPLLCADYVCMYAPKLGDRLRTESRSTLFLPVPFNRGEGIAAACVLQL